MKVKKTTKRKMKGKGVIEDVDKWFKKSKVLSTVAGVVLPTVLGSAGGILSANPLGGLAGASLGALGSEYLKQIGYGQSGYGKRKNRGGSLYTNGQLPVSRMMVNKGSNVGAGMMRIRGGSSVYNNVASDGSYIRF